MVNVKPVQLGKTTRMSFGKIAEALEMPNLIEVQKDSYNWLQRSMVSISKRIKRLILNTIIQMRLLIGFLLFSSLVTLKMAIIIKESRNCR